MLTFPRISSGILPASFSTWSSDPPSCRDMSHHYTLRFHFRKTWNKEPSVLFKLTAVIPTAFLSHHVLHADADLSTAVKGSIEAHNVGRVAFMQHLQLSDNLVSNCRLDFEMDQLKEERRQSKPLSWQTQQRELHNLLFHHLHMQQFRGVACIS